MLSDANVEIQKRSLRSFLIYVLYLMLFVIILSNQLKVNKTYQYQHIKSIVEGLKIVLPEKYNVIRYNNITIDDWTQFNMSDITVNIFPEQRVTFSSNYTFLNIDGIQRYQ